MLLVNLRLWLWWIHHMDAKAISEEAVEKWKENSPDDVVWIPVSNFPQDFCYEKTQIPFLLKLIWVVLFVTCNWKSFIYCSVTNHLTTQWLRAIIYFSRFCEIWAIPLLALTGLTHGTAGIEFKMASFTYLAIVQGPQFFSMWSHPPAG